MIRKALIGLVLLLVATSAVALPAVRAGEWFEIPDSTMRTVAVKTPSVEKIVAWSSGALDPGTSRLYVWGGGHGDYFGNEVYAFDLNTLQWARLSEPSVPDKVWGADTYGDGQPRARHSYDYIEFVPAVQKLVSFGGAALSPWGGATTRRLSEFNGGQWITGLRAPVPSGGSMIGAHARLDPVSGDVFVLTGGNGSLRRYTVASNSWSGGWSSPYVRVHATAAIDPQRRQLVLLGSGTDTPQILKWDLDVPGAAQNLRNVTTGDKEIERAQAPGFDFHPPSGKFYAWAGGAYLYVLDPATWHWERVTAGGAAPGAARTTGTYGRFRYVPALDVFVLMNGVDSNVFVYRPPPTKTVGWVPVIPEHTFVEGIAETVQTGIWQIDPENRWPSGDLTRASGWRSNYDTKLIDVATALPPEGFSYDGRTGELSYLGEVAGDRTVQLLQVGGRSQSPPFRVRVLRPNNVWGYDAEAVNAEHGWEAPRVCNYPAVGFSGCRLQGFKGGTTDSAPMVIFITAGTYPNGQTYYIPPRPFVYVEGDANERPMLNGGSLGGGEKQMMSFRNLALTNTNLMMSHPTNEGPNRILASKVWQCCETADVTGLMNPNKRTVYPWSVDVWNSEFVGTGSLSNTQHSFYIEGRPDSRFHLNNVQIRGSVGSSSIKTTMQDFAVRHSLLSVSRVIGDVSGICSSTNKTGCLTHTPIDVPSYSSTTVYGNTFYLWRQTTVGVPTGRSGILAGAVFFRLRQNSWGSDVPAYPNLSWDPPSSSMYGMSPGPGWSRGPETYVADAFWAAVRQKPVSDPENPLTFQHYVGFNKFVMLPDSLPITIVRDDGSHAGTVAYQFGPTVFKPVHWNWLERSVTFLHGNTYEGVPEGYEPIFKLKLNQYATDYGSPKCVPGDASVNPCSKYPRDLDEEFPHVVEVAGPLPDWFKL